MKLFNLPSLQEKEVRKKRPANTPDISKFNKEQHGLYDGLLDWLDTTGGGMALLEGPGGAGKTFVLSRVLEQYLKVKWNHRVASTATTNKAVKVAYTMSEYYHSNLEYATIHSLLALKETIRYDGSIDFIPDNRVSSGIVYCKVVTIDESSMLQDSLFGYLQPYIKMGLKVIFMGDRCQTPPIGCVSAMPFDSIVQKQYGIKVFSLTQIVRQALDNPIIQFTQCIRERPMRIQSFSSYFKGENRLYKGDEGLYFINRYDREQNTYFDDLLKHVFTSENFKQSADFAKVIAWRNKTVNTVNKGIRRMIFGKGKLRRIELGEKLVTSEPVFNYDGSIDIGNSEELEVLEFNKDHEIINDGQFMLTYYNTCVRYFDFMGNPITKPVRILSDLGQMEYDKICNMLAAAAKTYTPGSLPATTAWREFYAFKRKFAAVGYNYAITVHKCQGSSYSNAIVLEMDIMARRIIKERNQLLYTAASRPRHRLFIV